MTFFPLANCFSFGGRFKLTLTVVVVTEELLVMTKDQLCNSGHSVSKGQGWEKSVTTVVANFWDVGF